ncbi:MULTISPECIES: ArdC family protein [Sphingomonas]|uniref:ArdC family protein n=1 Tax=Sphingomonas TaxID=13687 RepID=UPI0024086BAA|nr:MULTISPECIES: ArdC-like ssDNA-binding domain-containing protein [Sphingomonas]
MPSNAVSGRSYSGINVLILWAAAIDGGYAGQRWLTYRQAEAAGGHVRRGEKSTVVCYADRFTPKDEAERTQGEDPEARTIAFLKRFTVFNVDQCDGVPEAMTSIPVLPDPVLAIAEADRVIAASGAGFRIGGSEAYHSPSQDFVQVPPQVAFHDPVNWYRTALHELGHFTGHRSRLDRDQSGAFGSASYAKEELVADETRSPVIYAAICATCSDDGQPASPWRSRALLRSNAIDSHYLICNALPKEGDI